MKNLVLLMFLGLSLSAYSDGEINVDVSNNLVHPYGEFAEMKKLMIQSADTSALKIRFKMTTRNCNVRGISVSPHMIKPMDLKYNVESMEDPFSNSARAMYYMDLNFDLVWSMCGEIGPSQEYVHYSDEMTISGKDKVEVTNEMSKETKIIENILSAEIIMRGGFEIEFENDQGVWQNLDVNK